jgi:hypothetical protein
VDLLGHAAGPTEGRGQHRYWQQIGQPDRTCGWYQRREGPSRTQDPVDLGEDLGLRHQHERH